MNFTHYDLGVLGGSEIVEVCLDGNAANNEMGNIVCRQRGDGGLGRLHDAGGARILPQRVGGMTRHRGKAAFRVA